jgi:hypothetical protein
MFEQGKHERNTSVQKRGSRAIRPSQEEETKKVEHQEDPGFKVHFSNENSEKIAMLKDFGDKAEGGFFVEIGDNCVFQLEWYNSSDL